MAGNNGGARPGAGRKKGVPNKKTREQQQAIAASGMTPLEFLLSVMRDPKRPLAFRQDAAKAAAPYVHPKLAQVTLKGDEEAPLEIRFGWQPPQSSARS